MDNYRREVRKVASLVLSERWYRLREPTPRDERPVIFQSSGVIAYPPDPTESEYVHIKVDGELHSFEEKEDVVELVNNL